MDSMTAEIDITTDGEYRENGEVKIVMTVEQFRALATVLDVYVNTGATLADIEGHDGVETANMIQGFAEQAMNAADEAGSETVANLAREFGMQPYELLAYGDLGFRTDDAVLDAETVRAIRESMAREVSPE